MAARQRCHFAAMHVFAEATMFSSAAPALENAKALWLLENPLCSTTRPIAMLAAAFPQSTSGLGALEARSRRHA